MATFEEKTAEQQDDFSRLLSPQPTKPKRGETGSITAKVDPKGLAELSQMKRQAEPELSPSDALAKRYAQGGLPIEQNLGVGHATNPFTGELRTDRLQPGESLPAPEMEMMASHGPNALQKPESQGVDIGGDPRGDGSFGMGGGAATFSSPSPELPGREQSPLVGDLIDTYDRDVDDPFAWLAMFQQGKQMSTDLANRSQRDFNNRMKVRKTDAESVRGDFQRSVLSDIFKQGGKITPRMESIANLVFPNYMTAKTAYSNAAQKQKLNSMGITADVKEGLPGEPGAVVWNVKGGAAPIHMNTDEAQKILPLMEEYKQAGLTDPYQAATQALLVVRGQR